MNYQIRIRTDQDFSDILPIKSYLQEAKQAFVFQHAKEGNNHYHVYLFNIDKQADSIRKTLHRYYEKQNYSVSTTAGKKKDKIRPHLAWQYGTEDKLLDPVYVHGINDEMIQAYKQNAKDYYDALKTPMTATLVVTKEEHYVVKPDRVWERLYSEHEDYENMTLKEIKSKISVDYLNNGKAIPRPSDLHRYALSLLYLNKFRGRDIPAKAMIDEY